MTLPAAETPPRSLQERVGELEKKMAWVEKLLATWLTARGPRRPLIDAWQPDPRPASPASPATGRPVRGPRIGRRWAQGGEHGETR